MESEALRRLDAAIARRRTRPSGVEPLDAFRWVNGRGDDAPPGLVVDQYADYVVISAREQLSRGTVAAWIEACQRRLQPRGIVLKTLARRAGRGHSEVVRGTIPRTPVAVREGDAVFHCDLDDGVQTGLFLDHRDTRFGCRPHAAGVEVLNLFAYTGAFSVHAALAGATRVTSVDVSRRALRRGRENLVASGLDPDAHRWFADDVLDHLRRGAEGVYGLIILDPPVMGRGRTRTFSLDRDLDELLRGAIRKLAREGVLVFSTHARRWTLDRLMRRVEAVANAAGRPVVGFGESGLPPWDHPARDDAAGQDRGDYLKTLVLRLG